MDTTIALWFNNIANCCAARLRMHPNPSRFPTQYVTLGGPRFTRHAPGVFCWLSSVWLKSNSNMSQVTTLITALLVVPSTSTFSSQALSTWKA